MCRRWHFSLDYQSVQNKMFRYKTNLNYNCKDCKLESRCVSFVSVECCQVEVIATGLSYFQTISTMCVFVCLRVCVCARAFVFRSVWSDTRMIL
jgi:hypothetical protein